MSHDLHPALRTFVDSLIASGRRELGLDELGDTVAALPISYADLERLMLALEQGGIEVSVPETPPLPTVLAKTLDAIRDLQAELARRPTLEEITGRTSLAPATVRAALLYARVLARGGR